MLSACTFRWPWQKKAADTSQNQASVTNNLATSSSLVFTKQVKKFADDNELKSFLAEQVNSNNYTSSNSNTLATSSPLLNYRADAKDPTAPDIIKVSGDYVYSLVRNDLLIAKVKPVSDAKVVAKISFNSRPQGILINGTNVAVYGADTNISAQPLYKNFRRQNPYTFLKVYDLSDPVNPKLVRDLAFEGTYNSARLVGDYVYFLTDTPNSNVSGEPLLPRVIDTAKVLSPVCGSDQACFAPELYYFDIAYNSLNFLNITAINIRDNSEALNGQVYLIDNSQSVYVSLNNIYLTYTASIDENSLEQAAKREIVFPKLVATDQAKVNQIEAAPDYLLNSNEKKLKVGSLLDNYIFSLSDGDKAAIQTSIDDSVKQQIIAQSKDAGQTEIYRLAMGNKVSYEAVGEVNGQLIDKYSLDETNNYLRIATVVDPNSLSADTPGTDFYSNLYILDKDLKPVGSLENLATTAAINTARFVGNRAYFSTAQAADPLYIIGLNDPTKPAVLGAVKVSGTYDYLLPLDSDGNKLISFGRAADANGVSTDKGLKLSIFDFTDLQKPRELDSYVIGDGTSDSIALSDPTTLSYFYSGDKTILMVPAALKDKGSLNFAGTLVFNLANDRLVLKGKIDHSFGGHFTDSELLNGINYYDNTVKRGLYSNDSDDLIYTYSNKLLRINKFSDLSSVKDLILTPGSDDYIITQPAVTAPAATSTAGLISTSTPLNTASSTLPVQSPAAGNTSLPGNSASSTAPAI